MSDPRPLQKIVLAGATGLLGGPMLSALRAANFDITVFTRQDSQATFPSDVKVARVDYSSVESLTAALRGQDAFISTITTSAVATQKAQVDAAVAAGVRRYIPSEFGCDASIASVQSLPMYQGKDAIARYVVEKCAGTATTYTFVYTDAFLDWALDNAFYLDLKNRKINLYEGGDVEVTTTPTDFVGRGVAAILRKAEVTANRAVRLQGAVTTQRELLGIAKKYLGEEEWEVVEDVSSAEEERKARENLARDPGDFMGWIWGMLVRACFGEGYSRNFVGGNDNALLGLEEISPQELEGYVRRSIETGFSSIL